LKNIVRKLFLVILLFRYFSVLAQTDSVKYTEDFVFKDGIYITFQDFKNNNPPLTPENFKKYNPDVDYFGEKLSGPQIKKRVLDFPVNKDSTGNIFSDSVFAYVINSTPFILKEISTPDLNLGIIPHPKNYKIKEVIFYKFFKLGKLSLIYPESKRIRFNKDSLSKSLVSIEEDNYHAPFFDSYGFNTDRETKFTSSKLYILSFDSGNIYKFKLKFFSMLLEKKDKELFKEFSKLSKGQQEDVMFLYVKKLNERKPIYFKINN